MKVINLIDNIDSGLHIQYLSNGEAWLVRPEQYIQKLDRETVKKAIKKGWLKRDEEGRYVVTPEGRRQL